MRLIDLRTEYRTDPLGVQTPAPRFSWRLSDPARGADQSAYQIQAGSAPGLSDLWDTGRVASARRNQIAYAGAALASSQVVYWRARVWDQADTASLYAAGAFEMGLLDGSDWGDAEFIGFQTGADVYHSAPSPLLRTDFQVPAGRAISRVRAYATAQGLYRLSLNGVQVSQDRMTPGYTSYNKRCHYQTYDVAALVHSGLNGIGMELGDGWFCGNLQFYDNGHGSARNFYGDMARGLALVRVWFTDGGTQDVVTDSSWQALSGPILASDIYNGETYDARLARPGFARAGYPTAGWSAVDTQAVGAVLLYAQPQEPARAMARVTPKTVTAQPDGSYVFDFGQNLAGVCTLTLADAAPGQTVVLKHREALLADGSGYPYVTNLGTADQTDRYTCAGGALETWEPAFTYHGFRYVQVSGLTAPPPLSLLSASVLHTHVRRTSTFACSSELLTRLWKNLAWSQASNSLSIPSDCCNRNERLGWMADIHLYARAGLFMADCRAFLSAWVDRVIDDQAPDGTLCNTAPALSTINVGDPCWSEAVVILPWYLYLFYGDTEVLARGYPAMKAALTQGDGPAHYQDYLGGPESCDANLMTRCWVYFANDLFIRIATLLGHTEDVAAAQARRDGVAISQQNNYQNDGTVLGDTQGGYAQALFSGILPEGIQPLAAAKMAARFPTGQLLCGMPSLSVAPGVLRDWGRADLAYATLLYSGEGSWGDSVAKGATTVWEQWDAVALQPTTDPNSMNHPIRGGAFEFLMTSAAGIAADETSPGFARAIMRPQPAGVLTWARGSYGSIVGTYASDWALDGGVFTWRVTVPPGGAASAFVPTSDPASLTESGAPVAQATGVTVGAYAGGFQELTLQSGGYTFHALQ